MHQSIAVNFSENTRCSNAVALGIAALDGPVPGEGAQIAHRPALGRAGLPDRRFEPAQGTAGAAARGLGKHVAVTARSAVALGLAVQVGRRRRQHATAAVAGFATTPEQLLALLLLTRPP